MQVSVIGVHEEWPELPELQLRYLLNRCPWIYPIVDKWPETSGFNVQLPRSTPVICKLRYQAAAETNIGTIGVALDVKKMTQTWGLLAEDPKLPDSGSSAMEATLLESAGQPSEYLWNRFLGIQVLKLLKWDGFKQVNGLWTVIWKPDDVETIAKLLKRLKDLSEGPLLSEWPGYLNHVAKWPNPVTQMVRDHHRPETLGKAWESVTKLAAVSGWRLRKYDYDSAMSVMALVDQVDATRQILLGAKADAVIARVHQEQEALRAERARCIEYWKVLASELRYHQQFISKFGQTRYEQLLGELPSAARLNTVDFSRPSSIVRLADHVSKAESNIMKLMKEEPAVEAPWMSELTAILRTVSPKTQLELWNAFKKKYRPSLADNDTYRISGLQAICPHQIELIQALGSEDSLSKTERIINYYAGEQISETTFCRVCGSVLNVQVASDLGDVVDFEGSEKSKQDPLEISTIRTVLELIKEVEWTVAHSSKYIRQFCQGAADAIIPFIRLVDAKLAKNKTGTEQERRAKITLFQYVYGYAIIMAAMIAYPDEIIAIDDKKRSLTPKVPVLTKHFANSALQHISHLVQYLDTTDTDFMTSAISKAYSHISNIYQGVGLEPEVDLTPIILQRDLARQSIANWYRGLGMKVPIKGMALQTYETIEAKRSKKAEKLQKAVRKKQKNVALEVVDWDKAIAGLPSMEVDDRKLSLAEIRGLDPAKLLVSITNENFRGVVVDKSNYEIALACYYQRPMMYMDAPNPGNYQDVGNKWPDYLRLVVGRPYHRHEFTECRYEMRERADKKSAVGKLVVQWTGSGTAEPVDMSEYHVVGRACKICHLTADELLAETWDASRVIRQHESVISFFNYYQNRCPSDKLPYHDWVKDVCKNCKATRQTLSSQDLDYYKRWSSSYEKPSVNIEIRRPNFDLELPKMPELVLTNPGPSLETKLREELQLPKGGLIRALQYLGCSTDIDYDSLLAGSVTPNITNGRCAALEVYNNLILQSYLKWQHSKDEEFQKFGKKPSLAARQLYWNGIGKKGQMNYLEMRRLWEIEDLAGYQYQYLLGMLQSLVQSGAWSFLSYVISRILKGERDLSKPPERILALTGGLDEAQLEDEDYREALPVDKSDRNTFSFDGMDYDGSNEEVIR